MVILGLDTSGKYASCALWDSGRLLGEVCIGTSRAHSRVILPMATRLIAECGREIGDIDGFAVVTGPGSYTGLRIGIGAVKGLCFGSGKPCAGVSALEAIAMNFCGSGSVVCAVMHARQELYYGAFFEADISGNIRRLGCDRDRIIPIGELANEAREWALQGRTVICAGEGCGEVVAMANEFAANSFAANGLASDEPAANSPAADDFSGNDKGEAFSGEFPRGGGIFAAPGSMCMPSPGGICMIAEARGFHDPEELSAEYMQVTKAEKDLREAGK